MIGDGLVRRLGRTWEQPTAVVRPARLVPGSRARDSGRLYVAFLISPFGWLARAGLTRNAYLFSRARINFGSS